MPCALLWKSYDIIKVVEQYLNIKFGNKERMKERKENKTKRLNLPVFAHDDVVFIVVSLCYFGDLLFPSWRGKIKIKKKWEK